MIDRYSRLVLRQLWSLDSKFQTYLRVEQAVLDAQAELGLAPPEAAAALRGARVDLPRIAALEAEVKHDVIAFVTSLAEQVGPLGRYIHQGLTSSDVIDTAFSLQLRQAAAHIDDGFARVMAALHEHAKAHARTVCMGRSHGIHAEPTTFGLKMLGFYAEFARARARVAAAATEVATAAVSGPMGTFSSTPPAVEAKVAERLGLAVEPVSTQVIPRDRHAAFMAALGVAAGAVERLATEIRHLQRTEVRELREAFGSGQKGSSAMPHKRNPILSENLTGLARLVRGYVPPALENIALWHERDMSHSSVERVAVPDATATLDFALHRLAEVVAGLEVDPARMAHNMAQSGGLHHSQRVLLALVNAGQSREAAYALVQKHALAVWDTGGTLHDRLAADPQVATLLPAAALGACFDDSAYTAHVAEIFDRVLRTYPLNPSKEVP